MFYRCIRSLRRFINNPIINIIVGLAFLYTGLADTVEQIQQHEDIKIGSHHGVVLYAIVHILKAIPDLFESIEKIEDAGQMLNKDSKQ